MSKRFLLGGAAVWLCATVSFQGVALAQAPAAKPVMDQDIFKNLKVLRDIPVDEFMGTMGLFSAALNVCCGDCHVGAGGSDPMWDSDAKPEKNVARKMVTMVDNLNKQNFGGAKIVTCWTCHRGSEFPAQTPPLDSVYGEAVVVPPDVLPAVAANSGAPTVDQIFDKYFTALGGTANLQKLKSYVEKGTSRLFGETMDDPAEISAKAPNMLATYVHQREGDLARVDQDNTAAWVMLPLTVVGQYKTTGAAFEGAKFDAQLAFPLGLKDYFKNWHAIYPATIQGTDVYGIQGGANGLLVSMYFDRKTGLPRRVIRYNNTVMGRVPTQIDYDDYRPVGGVMMPHKFTYAWISGREDYVISEITPNAPVDDSKFKEPVQRAK
jgi:photosynthetic reaction center cytochrome c subunit